MESHISEFHKIRAEKIGDVNLKDILKRKNPYLFKAKNCNSADALVRGIVDSYISSQEETLFGNWLEQFAIYICACVYDGRKSTTKGIDLEFSKDGTRFIVSIKSGPNWGNSGQIREMKEDFTNAKRALRTSGGRENMVAVNGCCYGKDDRPDKGTYYKYCGQDFWHFISGEKNLYLDIVEPLGTKAKERNDEYQKTYDSMINRLLRDFITEFCISDGTIDWDKLVKFNSKAMRDNHVL